MGCRLTWPEICQHEAFQGRWVALDQCKYDARTARPVDGVLVDVDDDLVALCSRIREGKSRYCAILFCGDTDERTMSSTPLPAARLST
jgi:hypothetical protein